MYQKPKNPKIDEITKSYKERMYPLGDLKAIKVDGGRQCIWCLTALKGQQLKWCSPACSNSAMAWGYPQKEHGLQMLLAKQDFKCNGCGFDYMPYLQQITKKVDANFLREKINERYMTLLKRKVPADKKPEVDHIVPIYKGGQSLGLANHNILCYSCHKAKTKADMSGKRKKE